MFCTAQTGKDIIVEDSRAKKIENYIFNFQDLLGQGNFGSAYAGYDVNTGKQVAIKVVKLESLKSKVTQKLLQNEVQILRNLKEHPNLLKCYNVFTSANNCYIITELCQSDLQQELKKRGRFKQNQIRKLIYGIYKGLEQLGKSSVIHRDIKTSNIFVLQNKIAKIADYGFAVKSNVLFKDLNIGTPLYMSPQGLIDNIYGPKTDVWSFGIILYELLHGQTPFYKCTKQEELKSQVLRPISLDANISPQLRQLIFDCLTINQSIRPDIFQLAKLPYIRRLINQFQGRPISLKQSMSNSTDCSQEHIAQILNPYFFKGPLTYDNCVSILNYCRLIHKLNNKILKSGVVSQILINLSYSLTKAQISAKNSVQQQRSKLKQALQEYHSNFKIDYQDMDRFINPNKIFNEIGSVKTNPNVRSFLNAFEIVENQTKLLLSSLQLRNPNHFTQNSQSKFVIENQKLNLCEGI